MGRLKMDRPDFARDQGGFSFRGRARDRALPIEQERFEMRLRALQLFYFVVVLGTVAAVAAPKYASALTTFTVTTESTRPLWDLYPGDTVTISIRLSGGTGVYGLGLSAYGYNESVIDFTSGTAVSSINHAVCVPSAGCFSGLSNALVAVTPGTFGTGPLGESAIGSSGNRVLLFNGVGLSATNSNPLDPGLDGVLGGGGAQMRLVFTSTGPGSTNIIIGTGYNGDGEVLVGGVTDQSVNVVIPIGYIPEPGTALLLGLGLAGLASIRSAGLRRGR